MPIIAKHHKYKDADHIDRLRNDWPDDCYVQWGKGIVLGGKDGVRGTAFFEAFPKNGGFIRGEGNTICDAENSAFQKFEKSSGCQHHWSRRDYTNGGCICVRCGVFQVVMKPITKLGSWRDPIDSFDIENAIRFTGLGPSARDKPEYQKHNRRDWLRLRLAGFDLPEPPEDVQPLEGDFPGQTSYAKECENVIFSKLHELGGPDCLAQASIDSLKLELEAVMAILSSRVLVQSYEKWLDQKQHINAAPEV
jgi:hypothetical protein